MRKIFSLLLILALSFILVSCGSVDSLVCQHEYETTIVEGTCQEKGEEIRTCKKCGYELKVTTTYGDHKYGEWEEIEEATCQHTGKRKHVCSLCSHEEEEVLPQVDHLIENVVITKQATCTTDGSQSGVCKYCKKQINNQVIKATGHNYESTTVESTCSVAGHIDYECSNCHDKYSEDLPLLEHTYGDWEVVVSATSTKTGLKQHTCSVCQHVEEKIIPILDYIDFSYIEATFDESNTYSVGSYKELMFWFNVAIINKSNHLNLNVTYKYGTLDDLTKKLVEDCNEFSYSLSASAIGTKVTFDMSYSSIAVGALTNTDAYLQYPSANYLKITSKRDASYDDFPINKSSISMKVKDSEQLFYCLEHAAVPIMEENSDVEKLYKTMKDVLRSIIDDSMTDFEKIKAIHDYLILNVCYDADLLNTMLTGIKVSFYNGFYLEGVFYDHRAVCDGISKALCCLANMEGIPCVQVSGYQTANPNGSGHAWNKILLDDNWYVIDATSDGLVVNNSYEILNYNYFLISDYTMQVTYTAKDFTDIVCDTDYDKFSNMYVPYYNILFLSTENVCLKVKSFSELKKVISYFHQNYVTNLSIQIEFDKSYTCNKTEEILKAYHSIGVYSLMYNVIEKDNTIIFVRS